MFLNVLDFVSQAVRGAVECSIQDLRDLPEIQSLRAFEAVRALERICEDTGIECSPSLTAGELTDKKVFSAKRDNSKIQQDVDRALQMGECHYVEFKQTLGLHIRRLEKDPTVTVDQLFSHEIVHESIKTIISFLNSDGGTLLVGVSDDGAPFGIENEFPYVGGSRNLDAWALKLNSALEAHILDYRRISGFISQAFVERGTRKICVISVTPRKDRICVCTKPGKDNEGEIVYRRSGNSTLKLQARDIEALVLDRIRLRSKD